MFYDTLWFVHPFFFLRCGLSSSCPFMLASETSKHVEDHRRRLWQKLAGKLVSCKDEWFHGVVAVCFCRYYNKICLTCFCEIHGWDMSHTLVFCVVQFSCLKISYVFLWIMECGAQESTTVGRPAWLVASPDSFAALKMLTMQQLSLVHLTCVFWRVFCANTLHCRVVSFWIM